MEATKWLCDRHGGCPRRSGRWPGLLRRRRSWSPAFRYCRQAVLSQALSFFAVPFFRAWGRRIRWGLRRCPANRFCRPTPRTRRSASDFHAPPPRPPPGPETHVWGRSSVESRPDRRWSRGVRPPPPWGRCTRLVRPWAAVGASCGPKATQCAVGGQTRCPALGARSSYPPKPPQIKGIEPISGRRGVEAGDL